MKKQRRRRRRTVSYGLIRSGEVFEFRPELAVSPDTARVGAIQRESARVCAESARVEEKKKKKKEDAAPTRRQRRRSRVAESDAGAAAVLPRPCILSSPKTSVIGIKLFITTKL